MTSRRRVLALVLALVAIAAIFGVSWLLLRPDPTEQVGAVPITGVTVDPVPTSATRSQQVEALEPLEGTLRSGDPDDPEEFMLGAVELDFGPEAWVLTAGPIQDYDGDQTTEPLIEELDALVGKPVSLLVRPGDQGDNALVFTLNRLPYRDPAGQPPWLTATPTATATASLEQVRAAAVAAVGPGARIIEIEPEPAGQVAWEATVLAANGATFTVLLSPAAQVLYIGET
jgi:hypothetical protein